MCFTPRSFLRLEAALVDPVVVRVEVLVFDVFPDCLLFVFRDAKFFSNDDTVVAFDFPDERVTFFPVEVFADGLRDFDVEVVF